VKIAIFQFCPDSYNVDRNMEAVSLAVEQASSSGVSLLLLPELWSTGLLSVDRVRDASAKTPGLVSQLVSLASRFSITVGGSLPEPGMEVGGRRDPDIWNTTYVVGPDGVCCTYRKINLFRPMGEHRVFRPGDTPVVFDVPGQPGLRAGLMTCFDLRFPELARELVWRGASLLLVSALWPMVRRGHFELLLQARAIENQCFVAGANACGINGSTEFAGASCLVGPAGDVLAQAAGDTSLLVQDVDLSLVDQVRKRFLTACPPRQWACKGEKILQLPALLGEIGQRRLAGQKMVFTNGCFDILHAGHVDYLQQARRQGDLLVVGLNSDRSVREIKGPERPINPQEMRASVLAGLCSVDYVTIFDEPTPERLIERLLPDVLVKGADWAEDEIVGASLVKDRGGRVVRIPFAHAVSTTETIGKIRDRGAA